MNETSVVQLTKGTFSEWSKDKVPRLAGGADISSNPHTDNPEGTTAVEQSRPTKPAGAGALAGFLVGLVLGRRQRAKDQAA